MSGTKGRRLAAGPEDRTGERRRSSRANVRPRVGDTTIWATSWLAVERKTPRSTPQGAKDAGGAAKPHERLRSVATCRQPRPAREGAGRRDPLKVNETPRRARPHPERDGNHGTLRCDMTSTSVPRHGAPGWTAREHFGVTRRALRCLDADHLGAPTQSTSVPWGRPTRDRGGEGQRTAAGRLPVWTVTPEGREPCLGRWIDPTVTARRKNRLPR